MNLEKLNMQRVSHMPLEVGIRSDIKYGNWWDSDEYINADYYEVAAFHDPVSHQIATLAVLACPLGRHVKDYEAARLVVNTIVQTFEQALTRSHWLELFQTGFREANTLVCSDEEVVGVSCSAVLMIGKQLFIAHCGGCPIFLIRDRHLKQLSADHSFLEMLVEHNHIQVSQIENTPIDKALVLIHCLGAKEQPDGYVPDLRLRLKFGLYMPQESIGITLQPFDQILLCSRRIFDLYATPDHRFMRLMSNVFSGSIDLQNSVDNFVAGVFQQYYYGSASVLALRVLPK